MTYAINPQVLINDVEYRGEAIQGVTLTNGRTTVDEQPRAGFATITLVTMDNSNPNIEIDYKVVVKVDDSGGDDVTLWTGWVSDIQNSIVGFGSAGRLNQQTITAIGSLAKLNRRLVGAGGYAKENDGDRVFDIIKDGAGITWAEYQPASDTWADVNPLLTWQNSDLLIGNIDRPGDFELVAYSGGATGALALAQQAAQSGLGVLFECPEGRICYSDYTYRTDDVAANGFTTIDTDSILARGLSSVSRLSDLINEIKVTYKNNQTESDENATSIALYGRFASAVNTILENDFDAEQRVEYYLETRAFPRTRLNQITLALHLDQVSDAMRDSMLPMRVSEPISITGLPSSIYPGTFAGFVEGFTWTINRNELFLTLNVSEYALSQLEINWLQVPPTLAWEDVSATLEWQEARVVA
jgi:hypothetical protein